MFIICSLGNYLNGTITPTRSVVLRSHTDNSCVFNWIYHYYTPNLTVLKEAGMWSLKREKKKKSVGHLMFNHSLVLLVFSF